MRRLRNLYVQYALLAVMVLALATLAPLLLAEDRLGGLSRQDVVEPLPAYLEFFAPAVANRLVHPGIPALLYPGLSLIFTLAEEPQSADESSPPPEADNELQIWENDDGTLSAILPVGLGFALYAVDPEAANQWMARKAGGCLVAFVMGSLLIILLLARQTIKPVQDLERAAKKVAGGDFTIRLPVSSHYNEVGSLIESFNAMVEDLGKVEILRSGFISDVSHEFKIPLTTISGYAKLLGSGCGPEETEEYTSTILEETARLSRLVDNILTLNRLERSVRMDLEPVPVAEQVRRVLTVYEPSWSRKQVDFRFELEEITIIGYPNLLMQVWTNLVDNAIKFTPEGGIVVISLTTGDQGRGVVFSIRDSGQGISPEEVSRIFDKFYQADNSRGTEGNGLGLAIVWRIVQIHGGQIHVESKPGEGTVFIVELPGFGGGE